MTLNHAAPVTLCPPGKVSHFWDFFPFAPESRHSTRLRWARFQVVN